MNIYLSYHILMTCILWIGASMIPVRNERELGWLMAFCGLALIWSLVFAVIAFAGIGYAIAQVMCMIIRRCAMARLQTKTQRGKTNEDT